MISQKFTERAWQCFWHYSFVTGPSNSGTPMWCPFIVKIHCSIMALSPPFSLPKRSTYVWKHTCILQVDYLVRNLKKILWWFFSNKSLFLTYSFWKCYLLLFFKASYGQTVGYPCIRSDEYLEMGNRTEHATWKALALFLLLSRKVTNPPSLISQLW